MDFIWDPVNTVNVLLCIIICTLAFLGYQETKNRLSIYVGIAFALFGLSHILSMMGLTHTSPTFLIMLRISAYIPIMLVLFQQVFGDRNDYPSS